MKTAMEILIEEINSTQVHFFDKKTIDLLRALREKATELLETEKKGYVDAFEDGTNEQADYIFGRQENKPDGEEYFNNTYKKQV